MGKHTWQIDGSPGLYDTDYVCTTCGATHSESADNLDSHLSKNKYGCSLAGFEFKERETVQVTVEIDLSTGRNFERVKAALARRYEGCELDFLSRTMTKGTNRYRCIFTVCKRTSDESQ